MLMLFQEVNVTLFRNKLQELKKGKDTCGHEVHAVFQEQNGDLFASIYYLFNMYRQ